MARPEHIKKGKLLLAEGKDAFHFLCHACNFYRQTEDVQVMDFGGNDDLPNFLLHLVNMDKFDEVNTIVIARDAETDAKAAIDSIRTSMLQEKILPSAIPVPKKPFEYTANV